MRVDRLVGIIMVLLEKGRVGAQELADMYEVSPRTIYRDVEAICRSGIPVRSIPGVGGGFEIMPGYKVSKGVFTTADLAALVTGLSGLSGILRSDDLANALAKVRSLIPAEHAEDIDAGADQVLIDMSPWMGNRDVEPLIATIRETIRMRKPLAFEYTSIRGEKTARQVEPYQLVLKGSRWYLHGYCLMREDFRLFRLARMAQVRIGETTFAPREHPKPQLDIDDDIAALQQTITLRIHKSIADRVLDYCPLECFQTDGDDHYLVEYPFIDREYWYDALLGFGPACEVVAPPSIREHMASRAKALAALY